LSGCDLVIRPGDRVLIQGPSGSGKSTLVSLLTGMQTPNSGLLLARGLDMSCLGETGWRSRVSASPQFHENHVLTESFAFNLLMSRSWPPRRADLEDARSVCEELGLGPLLERMPGGMFETVGVRPAGSCRTGRRAACSSRVRCSRNAMLSSSTKAWLPSTRRTWRWPFAACVRARQASSSLHIHELHLEMLQGCGATTDLSGVLISV